ncbi:amino acid transporter AVT1C-like [Diospyros lotus]|uniref:amino acid transporter AVT1C-like n=1 Tax=Diospyros lotus TaxID=55363 RepID=UPI002255B24A|nr:amino acid transporter AVT1C-like [Diospyros lotus]XP_052184554.1 amino acid transporter AVT1C-like [Diospyros lotus]XP_052184555.1 amino acid transporter AVT1C-like [Diospyros lotus]XP_052184556.1 amino acid transporter AVT1C-like [Diospyros lotus]
MNNSASEHNFIYSESEDEDAVKEISKAEDDGNGSDSSKHSNDNRQQSKPSSVTPAWPQSYRQSIDLYGSVLSPNISILGTSSLSRLGSSFLLSSLTRRQTPEILPSVAKPLLQTVEDGEKPKGRRSSPSLLSPIPSRKPSSRKSAKASHGFPATRQCSYGQAVVNGLNVLCGVGILSTPYAVKEGGWVGLSILMIFAVLSYYTGILLRQCLDSQPGLETYPDIGQAAFGTVGRFAISIILYVELYACCVEYIILETDNLSSLFPNAHLSLGGYELNSHHLFALLSTLVILPTVWLQDLSVLSYISVGGVVASILAVICLFWVGLVDKVGIHSKGSTLNLTTLPVAIGLYGFCYSGHAVFPNIYTSMAKPSQYPAVLLASFCICTSMYVGVAVLGYTMFGESTASQFTLNMPQDLVASKIALWTTVVNPFTKYALTMMPVAMSVEELIPSNHKKSRMYAILIRTALVISTLVVGLSIPFFGLVMALIGSLLTMLVALILPCACFLSISRGSVTRFQGCLCILIITVAVISSAFGTYSALSQIVQNLN